MSTHAHRSAERPSPAMRLSALAPSVAHLVFLAGFLLALSMGPRVSNADGDLGRHLRLGEWMLQHRRFASVDVFSYTATGREMVPHEWLAQVALAVAHRVGGFDGVGLLTALAVSLPWAVTVAVLRRRGVSPWAAVPLVLLGLFTSTVHWLARPHVFTFGFVVLWATLLEDHRTGGRRHVWWLVPAAALWANVHGAYIVGFVLVGTYLVAALAEGRAGVPRARHLAAVLAATLGASLLNPLGWETLLNSVGYLGEDFLVDYTHEYQSPDFHRPYTWPFLLMLGLGLAVPVRGTAPLLLLLSWAGFSLYSGRNIPLFALICTPFLAVAVQHRLAAWRPHLLRRPWPAPGGAAGTVLAGLLALLAAAALLGGPGSAFHFRSDQFPVEAMERYGANPPGERVFNDFGWGGYLLHCCWPTVRVFIDGQTDFYGSELTLEYARALSGRPGWEEIMERHGVDWVLLEPDRPLAELLRLDPGWRIIHEDGTAVVFVKAGRT